MSIDNDILKVIKIANSQWCLNDDTRDSIRNVATLARKQKDRIEKLTDALGKSLDKHSEAGVLGPDSRCTPDWFVELAAIQCDL